LHCAAQYGMLTPVAGCRLLLRRPRRIPPFSSYGGILGAVDMTAPFFSYCSAPSSTRASLDAVALAIDGPARRLIDPLDETIVQSPTLLNHRLRAQRAAESSGNFQ
jgi:hypothetical protein